MLIKQDAKRVVWLDCLRAILIILMVFGHAGSEYNTFIYLAHIPGFFVVSGYTSHLKSEICDYLYIKKTNRDSSSTSCFNQSCVYTSLLDC